MRRVLALALTAGAATFGLAAPPAGATLCAADIVCTLTGQGCTGTVNVCAGGDRCTGTVNACPGTDREDCAGNVDLCGLLGPTAIALCPLPPQICV